ncbi:MAG: AAA family ATPase, partial [Bacteroidales bacterium]|nr:AAA family ATPase [Bacteroidales bacterium]
MEEVERKYPVGIQTFSEIIEQHYVYVDKTDIVWQMAHYAKFIFFSRPRRFGKSLLTTTLEAYFEGRKDLFEGLKINAYEKEWVEYPVIRLDVSMAKNQDGTEELRETLMWIMKPYREKYGSSEDETSPGKMLAGLVMRAYKQTGRQVVVILDEYDAPLLGVLHDEKLNDFRRVMQEFYSVLKANERFLRYCFITGITKFSQLSIFSSMNNLMNITLQEEFSTVCGISHEELDTTLWPDVERLAKRNDCTAEEMRAKLNDMYDGYHFAEDIRGVYNPFSLFKAFRHGKLGYYWFDSGTPTYLIRQMEK